MEEKYLTVGFNELKNMKVWNRIPVEFQKSAETVQEYLMYTLDIECECLGDQENSIIIYY